MPPQSTTALSSPAYLAPRVLMAGLACLIVHCSALQAAPPLPDEKAPPNIILIVADDLGYGELGCYGQRIINTPHIDQLATDGIRFTQFYSGSPVCAPSRCSLITGKHTGHAHIRDNGDPRPTPEMQNKYGWEFPGQHPLPDAEVTIAERLKERGYATAAIGKWGLGHFGTSGDPNLQGFDLFFGYNCQRHAHNHYPTFLWRNAEKIPLPGNSNALTGKTFSQDLFANEALQFIRDHKDQPFFLYLPLAIPHLSIQVPDSSLAQYRKKIPEEEYRHTAYLQHPSPRAGYAAMISHMDRDVGRIVALVDQLGLGPDTLILFCSDNGPTYDRLGGSDSDFFRSAGDFRGLKGSLYEGGIRVPLVARWTDRIAPGCETDLLAAFWDMLPTFCEAAQVASPPATDGLSFLPTLLNEQPQPLHTHLLWEFPGYGGQQAVRMGRWKGVRQGLARGNQAWELYDLQEDPSESLDLADQHPEIVAQIDATLANDRTDSKLFPLFPTPR